MLLVDHADSFTWNLAALFVEAAQREGIRLDLRVVRHAGLAVADVDAWAPDALALSPGPCSPAEVPGSLELVRANAGRRPLFGVCLGLQVAAAAFGGRIVRAPRPVHGKGAFVQHDGAGVFAGLPRPLTAMRYHSLVVDAASLPPGFDVTAWLDDCDVRLVMGLRDTVRGIEAVQFHPESVGTPDGLAVARTALIGMAAWRGHVAAPSPA
ncbi:MAG: aminodeoxychorismate/anthranilate synthase component II [Myxococcales bacterium]|nr:aminodeoxychorismate/anthranilate synthase component II [Myxococcales bacterium]